MKAEKDCTPVVVGIGILSPAGNSVGEFAEHVFLGKVGNIRQITRFDGLQDPESFPVKVAGEVERSEEAAGGNLAYLLQVLAGRNTAPGLRDSMEKGWRRMDPFTRDAIIAGVQAVEQAGALVNPSFLSEDEIRSMLSGGTGYHEERLTEVLGKNNTIPVVIGSGYGGLATVLKGQEILLEKGPRRVLPNMVQESMISSPAARLACIYKFLGSSYGTSNACASGAQAIISAADKIRKGAEGAVVIGADALEISVVLASFAKADALTTYSGDNPKSASRPWDKNRTGFVLSEGAVAIYMVPKHLAYEKGVLPLAELAGWGESSDGGDNASNLADPNVRGPVLSMGRALSDSGLLTPGGLEALVYINAHATGTKRGDLNEAVAISLVLGEYLKLVEVSSTKSCVGHLIGGAGVIGAITCVLALQKGLAPGNLNLDEVDGEIAATGIRLPTATDTMRRIAGPRYAMANAFGFGGSNNSLVFRETMP